jgi:membrane dipeptidase
MTFVPSFVYQPPLEASIEQLLRHIEHICILGGENNLCFGSDFDGIQNKIPQLENFSYYNHLKEALLKRYPENLVRKWAWENAYQFYYKYLSKR